MKARTTLMPYLVVCGVDARPLHELLQNRAVNHNWKEDGLLRIARRVPAAPRLHTAALARDATSVRQSAAAVAHAPGNRGR